MCWIKGHIDAMFVSILQYIISFIRLYFLMSRPRIKVPPLTLKRLPQSGLQASPTFVSNRPQTSPLSSENYDSKLEANMIQRRQKRDHWHRRLSKVFDRLDQLNNTLEDKTSKCGQLTRREEGSNQIGMDFSFQ